MKKLVFALAAAACLALVAIAATPAILGGDGGAQSAGQVPRIPVKTAAGMPTFELWFIGGGGCCLVRSTTRTAEELGIPHVGSDFAVGPHLIATLVKALLAGPSPKEAALGFGNDCGADNCRARLLGVSIENGIVTLDLSSEFGNSTGPRVGPGLFQLAQFVYTVTQFPEIEGVRFKLEGRPLPVPPGTDPSLAGILPGCDIPEAEELLDRPVTREDYENAVDPTKSPPTLKSVEPTERALEAGVPPAGDFLEYLVTNEFDAPKHLVYKAWTTPELVERWWWSPCGKVTAEIDLKVGGTWRYRMVTSQGNEVVAHGKFREIVPNERIVLTAIYDSHYLEPRRHQQMLNTLTFTEVDGRTTLTILVQAQNKKQPVRVDVVFGQNGENELERVANSLR